MLTGLEKVKTELGLLCIPHNLAELAVYRPPISVFSRRNTSFKGLSTTLPAMRFRISPFPFTGERLVHCAANRSPSDA